MECEIMKNSKILDVKPGDLYLMVSDRMLSRFLDQCDLKKLVSGKDVGVISYNETPMKKYVKDGITVISTDFELMGRKAAEFVVNSEPINFCVPTKLTVRSSF
jgi:DNA-binding LacI/PurR family transcriptional regulator